MKIEKEIKKLTKASIDIAKKHDPAIIRLAVYADDIIYSFRKSGSLKRNEHNQVVNEVAKRLETDGIAAQIVIIGFDAYMSWLATNDIKDSKQARAWFTSSQSYI